MKWVTSGGRRDWGIVKFLEAGGVIIPIYITTDVIESNVSKVNFLNIHTEITMLVGR